MKAKYALIALMATALWGCDDNTAGLGLGLFPESDRNMNGKLTTFDVTTESVHAGQIYAMSSTGYVGKFTDLTFGTYEAGFLAELNCPTGLTFPPVYDANKLNPNRGEVMVDKDGLGDDVIPVYENDDPSGKLIGNVHTVELYLSYTSFFGDSLKACRLSVYKLNKNLDTKNAYYTNIDPASYYDHADVNNSLLGTKAYTAVDYSIKDSLRRLKNYVPSIRVSFKDPIARAVGKEIIKKANEVGASFDNKTFRDIFKGIYVKSDYGDGTVLYINQAQMNVVYKCYAVDTLTGAKLKKKVAETDGTYKDSTYFNSRSFNTTREIIQANQLKNDQVAIQQRIDDPEGTYLKSPAGIFTQLSLPVNEIAEKLQGDTLNAVKLSIPIYNELSDKKFGMSIPNSVLLIRKKYKDTFFEQNKLSDGVTSSLFDNVKSSNTNNSTALTEYTFSNITKMINSCLEDGEREAALKTFSNKGTITLQVTDANGNTTPEIVNNIIDWERLSDWNKFILIPVLVTKDSSTNQRTGAKNIISIQHDLKPGYVRLKGGKKATDSSASPSEQSRYKLKLEVVSTNFATTKTK